MNECLRLYYCHECDEHIQTDISLTSEICSSRFNCICAQDHTKIDLILIDVPVSLCVLFTVEFR